MLLVSEPALHSAALAAARIRNAATNSSGGVTGKAISRQKISDGRVRHRLKGQEGVMFACAILTSLELRPETHACP